MTDERERTGVDARRWGMPVQGRISDRAHVLRVGNDADYRVALQGDLGGSPSGFTIFHARDPRELDRALLDRPPDLVLLDAPWYGERGITLLRDLKRGNPQLRTVLLTPPGSENAAGPMLHSILLSRCPRKYGYLSHRSNNG